MGKLFTVRLPSVNDKSLPPSFRVRGKDKPSISLSQEAFVQVSSHASAEGRPMRAAFFGYSWLRNGALNGYMAENMAAIRQLGVDVDLYLANHFVARRGTQGFSPALSPRRLASHIRARNYDFAISFNNSLLMPEVVDSLSCKSVTVLVDSEQHLFDHMEQGGFSAFSLDIIIAPIFSSLQEDLERRYPMAIPRFHFLPPATCIEATSPAFEGSKINVSWIASLVGDDNLDRFARHISHSKRDSSITIRCLEQIARTGYLDDLRNTTDVADLVARVGWDIDLLEMHLQNIITNSERLAVVEKLSSRGLQLYGNPRWISLIPNSLGVARSLVIGEGIVTHAQQMAIYNQSRLSINFPQIQAKTGLQYRVLDVMASKALLVTRFIPGSDLIKLFGSDHPVPTFKDENEMVRVVDHFLANENERLDLVKQCNALLEKGFSFSDRAADYLRLSNPAAAERLLQAPHFEGAKPPIGRLTHVSRDDFINWTGRRP